MQRIVPVFILTVVFMAATHRATATPASFTHLGFLPGALYSDAYGVSAAGRVVVGVGQINGHDRAFRWTAASGMIDLGVLPMPGYDISGAFAVTPDGRTVVGGSQNSVSSVPSGHSFRWTQQTGLVDLGDLPGGNDFGQAQGVSGDGAVVVGMSSSHTGPLDSEAFRWTQPTGMVGIGFPANGVYSDCLGVSADANVMAGSFADDQLVFQAYRWTTATGFTPLGFLPGGVESHAAAVSADGGTAVGWNYTLTSTFDIIEEAFRWTSSTGMTGLGFLPNGTSSHATGVSPDGSFVVGYAGDEFNQQTAFIWDAVNGLRSLQDVLSTDPNVALQLTGWTLIEANAVSPDGYSIVGTGVNPDGYFEAYVAHLASPGGPGDMNCDGVVNAADASALVRALLDPAAYHAQYPACNFYNGDLNTDGAVDGDDIAAFVPMIIH